MKAGNWALLGVLFLLLTCIFLPALLASLVCFIGMVVAMQQSHGVAIANASASPKPMIKMPPKDRKREYAILGVVILGFVTVVVLMLWASGEYNHLFW